MDLLIESALVLYITSIIAGLCVGSFINVVIHRLPLMMLKQESATTPYLAEAKIFNLSVPGSMCPKCKQKIRIYDNIPLISFCLLRGRCRDCNCKISCQYPIVEMLAAFACFFPILVLGLNTQALWIIFVGWMLLAIAFIDIKHMLILDSLVYSLLWSGLLVNSQGVFIQPEDAIIGATAGYVSLWIINFLFLQVTKRSGMGHGDFKLLAAIGAWLGWLVLSEVLLVAALMGLMFGLFKMLKLGQPTPFGPWLGLSAWVFMLLGHGYSDNLANWSYWLLGLVNSL